MRRSNSPSTHRCLSRVPSMTESSLRGQLPNCCRVQAVVRLWNTESTARKDHQIVRFLVLLQLGAMGHSGVEVEAVARLNGISLVSHHIFHEALQHENE